MAKVGRAILAVVAGAAVWALLWLAGNQAVQAAFPDLVDPERPLSHPGILIAYIVYGSLGLSILAGYVTAAVAGARPRPAVWALAALQLALGLVAEVSYWELLPVWYHLVFLALIVPATVWGGTLRARGSRREAAGAPKPGRRAAPSAS